MNDHDTPVGPISQGPPRSTPLPSQYFDNGDGTYYVVIWNDRDPIGWERRDKRGRAVAPIGPIPPEWLPA